MITKVLVKTPMDFNKHTKQYHLQVVDDEHKSLTIDKKHAIFNMPTKLPMITRPKLYSKETRGGYLLNDVKFVENLFIPKKAYSLNYELSNESKIYDIINKISCAPFKINTELLDYISKYGIEQDLLMDPNKVHKYADIEKKTKYQKSEYGSYNSKMILQETILGIASPHLLVIWGDLASFL